MNTLIITLIRSFNGYIYETAGVITGFFSDAGQARACAKKIQAVAGRTVEVCGSQLAVSL
ncbi:MAG TPA: hypothetical protein VLU73_06200 [Methylococcaceae bacterium]|jgi:hypothetical protein|nr:hypothetical protein [Methylococcaceae bacterium]